MFTLHLGTARLQVEAVVADIEDDGLLGVDVLQNGEDGPTDLWLSKGVLKIHNHEVPIQIGVDDRIREVTAADHNIIPAQSEMMVDVHIERKAYDDFSSEHEYTIRPTENLQDHPLQISPTLVDITRSQTCEVRIVNPFPTAIAIKQNTILGIAEPIERCPMPVERQEDVNVKTSYDRISRLRFERYRSSFGIRKKRTRLRLKTKSRAVPVNTESASLLTHPVMWKSLALTAEKRKLVEELKAMGVNCCKLEPYEGDPSPPCIKRGSNLSY